MFQLEPYREHVCERPDSLPLVTLWILNPRYRMQGTYLIMSWRKGGGWTFWGTSALAVEVWMSDLRHGAVDRRSGTAQQWTYCPGSWSTPGKQTQNKRVEYNLMHWGSRLNLKSQRHPWNLKSRLHANHVAHTTHDAGTERNGVLMLSAALAHAGPERYGYFARVVPLFAGLKRWHTWL